MSSGFDNFSYVFVMFYVVLLCGYSPRFGRRIIGELKNPRREAGVWCGVVELVRLVSHVAWDVVGSFVPFEAIMFPILIGEANSPVVVYMQVGLRF